MSQSNDSSRRLSAEQVDNFQHNGYLVVKQAVSPEAIGALRRFTDEEIARGEGTIIWHDEAKREAARLSFLSERGGAYLDLIRSDALLDPLEDLVGPDIEFCHNRHNHLLVKPPGDRGTQWHRDQRGWSRPVITVIVAL
ncbi:MAG TPA: phytanoyl-CoA dioxygenase family protein, partial [Limnochordia bacterium]|nr:phytanoyl-CoA dioxygenase family protein [Limnochordia bacterium]